jgi:hypothetical protein
MEVSDMIDNRKHLRTAAILGVLALALIFTFAANVACKKKAPGTEALSTEPTTTIKVGLNVLEGTVKVASANYLYIPEIQGMDIFVQGMPDLAGLKGKTVRIEGDFQRERPSLLVANKIEVKEDGTYSTAFTRTEEPDLSGYIDLKQRAEFPILKIVNVNRTDAWEGQSRGKVFGKLEKQTGESGDLYRIVVNDDKGKLAGYVLVDSFSDYSSYYLEKLRLFNSFWFYLDIKQTVEARTRVRTRDLFHADVVCVGLF